MTAVEYIHIFAQGHSEGAIDNASREANIRARVDLGGAGQVVIFTKHFTERESLSFR